MVKNNYSNPKHQSEEVVNPIGGKGDGAVKKKANAAVGSKHLFQAKTRVVCQASVFLLKPFCGGKMQAIAS